MKHATALLISALLTVSASQATSADTTGAAAQQTQQAAALPVYDHATHTLVFPNGRRVRLQLPAKGQVKRLHSGGRLYEVDSIGNVADASPEPTEKEFEWRKKLEEMNARRSPRRRCAVEAPPEQK